MSKNNSDLSRQQLRLIDFASKILKPRPLLSGSEWANEYFYLSPESSSLPGKVSLYPYQIEMLDVMTDYIHQFVVINKSTRIGYTISLNIMQAYFIHQRPSSILHAQPNDEEIRGYATDAFEPMIRDNETIRELIETPVLSGKAKKEKTLKKLYPGGIWEGVGAQSERNFNRRTVRVFVADEIDTWVLEAGNAGDTLTTGIRRTQDFWDRKVVLGGKPISMATSKVREWFLKGDQRYRHLPCPHCGEYNLWFFSDFIWEKEYDDDGKVVKHLTDTTHVLCSKCGEKVTHRHYKEMDKKGKWIKHNPESDIASFHIWAFYSYSPNVTWPTIVDEFLDAKDNPLKLKAFTNEVLGEAWEESLEEIELPEEDERLEEYKAEVPKGVLALTCGVDVQDNRLECEVVGWGRYEESWSIRYEVIHGQTDKPFVWEKLAIFLASKFMHESGAYMMIRATGVDTGGHSTKQAYEFCRTYAGRGVFALKGHKSIDAPIVPLKPSFANKGGVALHSIGVNAAKTLLASYFTTPKGQPGSCHWPRNDDSYNAEYFKQLTAERKTEDGRWVKQRKRNEALDVRVYAFTALLLSGIDLDLLAHRGADYFIPPRPPKKKTKRSYLDEF